MMWIVVRRFKGAAVTPRTNIGVWQAGRHGADGACLPWCWWGRGLSTESSITVLLVPDAAIAQLPGSSFVSHNENYIYKQAWRGGVLI